LISERNCENFTFFSEYEWIHQRSAKWDIRFKTCPNTGLSFFPFFIIQVILLIYLFDFWYDIYRLCGLAIPAHLAHLSWITLSRMR
jgi:hypothetical protein